MNGFHIRIVSGIHGVASSTIEELPDGYAESIRKEGKEPADFTILYMKERNFLILNENHPCFEHYKKLCLTYMNLSEKDRMESLKNIDHDEIYHFLIIINGVMKFREANQRSSINTET